MILKIALKRGLVASIPSLDLGEPAYTTDTKRLYIGNGGVNVMFYNAEDVDALLVNYQALNQKGQANGYASLGDDGKIPMAQLPAIAIIDVYTAANEAAQLALNVQKGDICVRSDQNKSYIQNGGVTGTMTDWTYLKTPTDAVLSVNGQTGAVVIAAANISDFQSSVTGNTNVTANTAARHTHGNKSILDLVTEAFTTALKTKLDGIAAGAEVNVQSDWNASSGDAMILNKPTTITAAQATAIAANTAARHAHANQAILDAIEVAYTTALNTKLTSMQTGAQVNVQSDWNATSGDAFILNKPTTISAAQANAIVDNTAARHTHTNKTILDAIEEAFTTVLKTKLNGIEAGAEVNNISDTNAGLLIGGANTSLHYHAADRARASHTGTQTASTISDFAAAVGAAIGGSIDGGTF